MFRGISTHQRDVRGLHLRYLHMRHDGQQSDCVCTWIINSTVCACLDLCSTDLINTIIFHSYILALVLHWDTIEDKYNTNSYHSYLILETMWSLHEAGPRLFQGLDLTEKQWLESSLRTILVDFPHVHHHHAIPQYQHDHVSPRGLRSHFHLFAVRVRVSIALDDQVVSEQ